MADAYHGRGIKQQLETASPPGISARTVLADQLFRAGIEDRSARRNGQSLKIGEGLPATLEAITAAGLLERLQIRQAATQGRSLPLVHLPVPAHCALHGGGEIPAGAPAQLLLGLVTHQMEE
jgi:hypothetical protein